MSGITEVQMRGARRRSGAAKRELEASASGAGARAARRRSCCGCCAGSRWMRWRASRASPRVGSPPGVRSSWPLAVRGSSRGPRRLRTAGWPRRRARSASCRWRSTSCGRSTKRWTGALTVRAAERQRAPGHTACGHVPGGGGVQVGGVRGAPSTRPLGAVTAAYWPGRSDDRRRASERDPPRDRHQPVRR
jgi:hypothetical protein